MYIYVKYICICKMYIFCFLDSSRIPPPRGEGMCDEPKERMRRRLPKSLNSKMMTGQTR